MGMLLLKKKVHLLVSEDLLRAFLGDSAHLCSLSLFTLQKRLFGTFPFNFVPISFLTQEGRKREAEYEVVFIGSALTGLSPVVVAFGSLYGFVLFAVFLFSVLTGWGRRPEN